MKIIARLIAGSKLYGLDTPESDTDIRGVFLNEKPEHIFGWEKHNIQQGEGEDELYYELRHFLKLLKKQNTAALEILWAPEEYFTGMTTEFDLLREHREDFLDSERLFKSLMGYIQNEKRLFRGERTGKLGGKRIQAIKKYGYSPKNAVQLLRLINVGIKFFGASPFFANYQVDIRGTGEREGLMEIKTKPETFSRSCLERAIEKDEKLLKKLFDCRPANYKLNEKKMIKIISVLYA